MPKPTRQQQLQGRLEQAKRKLKLDVQNPFEKNRAHTRHQVLNKRDTQQRALNNVQTQSEEEIRKSLAANILEKQASKQFTISATQQIYNEVTQKSKQFRQERKQTNEQVEKNVMKFDQYSRQIASILPPRQAAVVQPKLGVEAESRLVQPQKLKLTQADAIRAGALRLQELQRERRFELHELELAGDDDNFGDIKSDISHVSDVSEFSDTHEKPQARGIADEAEEAQPIEQIPFILPVPATFRQFERLMNKVDARQEIVLYDRLIKINSTATDAKNAVDCERLAQFAFRRFLGTVSATRMDCAMRCLRHLAFELPIQVAQVFKTYFMRYKKVSPVQFALVLRVFLICYPCVDFVTQAGNVAELAFLCAESMCQSCIQSYGADRRRRCQLLFLVQQVALLSINFGRFDGMVLATCEFLLADAQLHPEEEAKDEVIDIIDMLFGQQIDLFNNEKRADIFIQREAARVVQFYCAAFQVSAAMLPSTLQPFAPAQIPLQKPLRLIRDAPPQIRQLDPVYAVNYNPRRGVGADVQLARQKAKAKAEQRKAKDFARKKLREVRAEVTQRQVKIANKRNDRKKVLNAMQGVYQEEVVGIKKLNKLEKLSQRGKK